MKILKLAALDIDGVLLNDTFSPVMKILVESLGGVYSRDIERNVFSRKRDDAASYIIDVLKLNYTNEEIIKIYFELRDDYIKRNGSGLNEGAAGILELLKSVGLQAVCYGGLPESYFQKEMKGYTRYFDQYICTDEFRPGIKEITIDIMHLEYNQALFIDDVNTVAESAKLLNVPFIGMPSSLAWGYQKKDMEKTGVKYMVSSLKEIDRKLIEKIDNDSFSGRLWK